jgi:NADH:ubiquinone oxidoreductase subunit F (NADH-binding)
MASIEGKRGEPRPRPPFPAVKGPVRQAHHHQQRGDLRQHPADHPEGRRVVRAAWAPSAPRAPRCLRWAARSTTPALVEVPMGTTLRRDHRGHRRRHPRRQEVQGGPDRRPLGGCIPAAARHVPIDYDNLIAIGSMMGSGGLIVMDEDTCMVDIAKVLPGLHRGRILRQVHALPHRHQAHAGDPRQASPRARRR